MKITIDNINYEVIKNYRDGFDEESFKSRVSDYFYEYDYIFGDWAYGKLRLKGFYDSNNKKVTDINNIKILEKYITENCAFGCRYFLLKKIVTKGKEKEVKHE